jgi:hypothetical protein
MIIKPENLIQLLGKSITAPEIERLKKELEDCEVADFDHIIHFCFYRHGFCLMFDDKILGKIQLFSEGADDYKEYPYPIPHGLSFSFTKSEVRAKLGTPSKAGKTTDIYQFPDHVLYVGFRTSPTISLLTLMTLAKFAE